MADEVVGYFAWKHLGSTTVGMLGYLLGFGLRLEQVNAGAVVKFGEDVSSVIDEVIEAGEQLFWCWARLLGTGNDVCLVSPSHFHTFLYAFNGHFEVMIVMSQRAD